MEDFKRFCEYCWESDPNEVILVKMGRKDYFIGVPGDGCNSKPVFTRQESELPVLVSEINVLVGNKVRVVTYRENGKYCVPNPDKIREDKALDY